MLNSPMGPLSRSIDSFPPPLQGLPIREDPRKKGKGKEGRKETKKRREEGGESEIGSAHIAVRTQIFRLQSRPFLRYLQIYEQLDNLWENIREGVALCFTVCLLVDSLGALLLCCLQRLLSFCRLFWLVHLAGDTTEERLAHRKREMGCAQLVSSRLSELLSTMYIVLFSFF